MTKKQKTPRRITTRPKRQVKTPFHEHVREFRSRLIWISLVVVSSAFIGYAIHDQLISILLRPAQDQNFIYTTPGGGLNFIIQVSVYFGIVIGIPVIIYHILRYLEPLLSRHDGGFVMKCAVFSAVLAILGIAFGYFIGLPAALNFLSDQINTDQIEALYTLNEYMSFVTIYMFGAAIMFQIPVVLLFINRVSPISAKKLAKSQAYVIVGAFIAAAIITPTPDIINQVIIALPIIAIYQVGVLLVAQQNRFSPALKVRKLQAADELTKESRGQNIANAKPVLTPEHIDETDDTYTERTTESKNDDKRNVKITFADEHEQVTDDSKTENQKTINVNYVDEQQVSGEKPPPKSSEVASNIHKIVVSKLD